MFYGDEYESRDVGFLVLRALGYFSALVRKQARMLAHILHVLAHVMAHLHHIWLIQASSSHYMAFQEQYEFLAPNISLHTCHLGGNTMKRRMSCYIL